MTTTVSPPQHPKVARIERLLADVPEELRPVYSVMDGAVMFADPPSVNFGLGIPPVDEWPGTAVGMAHVAAASGSGKDYFRYWHRALRHLEAWDGFWTARERRSEAWYYDHCEWIIRLIKGEWGGGKSTIMVVNALGPFAKQGIPCFHNGGPLFGWELTGADIFTALGQIPPCSHLNLDEAHTVMPRRLPMSTAVGTQKDLTANIRRKLCSWDLATGHPDDMTEAILKDCVEVLEPVKVEVGGGVAPPNVRALDDPANFTIGWKHWGNYPMKDPEWRKEGMRKYQFGMYDWRATRLGYALNNSFGRDDWAAAQTVSSDEVKDKLRQLQAQSPGSDGQSRQSIDSFALEVGQVMAKQGWETDYITPATLSGLSNWAPNQIGPALRRVYPGLQSYKHHGFRVADIARHWEKERGEEVPRL